MGNVKEEAIPGLKLLGEKLSAYYKKVEASQKDSPPKEQKKKDNTSKNGGSSEKPDSVLQMMDFAKKYEQGFRLSSKLRQGIAIPPPISAVHPVFMESHEDLEELAVTTTNPPEKNEKPVEKNIPFPFLDNYMSKFVEDIKIRVKSRSRSKSQSRGSSQSSTKRRGGKRLSRSRSRSISPSRSRSRHMSHSSSSSKRGPHSKSQRRSHSRSRQKSRSRSRTRHRSRSRSPKHHNVKYLHPEKPPFSVPQGTHVRYDDRGIKSTSRERKHEFASRSGHGKHPYKLPDRDVHFPERNSRWDSNPRVSSRWDSPQDISKRRDSRSRSPSERRHSFHKASNSKDMYEENGKFKIGQTLHEMENFVEIAKQKKLEQIKERNKKFLRQSDG